MNFSIKFLYFFLLFINQLYGISTRQYQKLQTSKNIANKIVQGADLTSTENKFKEDNDIHTIIARLEQESLAPVREAKNLNVVQMLQSKLMADPVVVIFGAPGSGKTEQMELALAGKERELFDLRNAFFKDYYLDKKITDKTEQEKLKKGYGLLKKEEREWIEQKKDEIIRNLAASKKPVIVFDEFDMSGDFKADSDELETAKIVLEIAQKVKALDNNKKIIFIIHEEGLLSVPLQKIFEKQFNVYQKDIIRTGYIQPAEELMLLSYSSLSAEEKDNYMKWAQGDPSAYLEFMKVLAKKEKLEISFQELQKKAKESVQKVYNVIKRIDPTVAKELDVIAVNGQKNINTGDIIFQRLLNTGLIGLYQGKYIMPDLVKEVILSK